MSKWWTPTEQEALEFELKDLLGDTEHFRLVVDKVHQMRTEIDGAAYLQGYANGREDARDGFLMEKEER